MSLDWFSDEVEVKSDKSAPSVEQPSKPQAALRKDDIVELSDWEHVLHRPAIYIGSVSEEDIPSFIYADGKIIHREVKQIPGLMKIIDEIIDNSVDEAIRTEFKFATKIDVEFKDGTVSVHDNGRGLPIEQREDGKWTPEVIYTKLRAGSNFEDEGRATMGMNGVGSSLTNIFSQRFEVLTANGHLSYSQVFENSMQKINRPKTARSHKNFTQVTFTPNYHYFKASEETIANIPVLIEKRLRNLAFAFPEIGFTFNGKRIAGTNLKQFLSQIHEVHEFSETKSARIGVFYSDSDFQHISFVNGLETKRGGTHIDNLTWKIVDHIREFIKKKHKLEVKPADVKSKLFLMFSMRITNAQFDGQTKERLMNPVNDYKQVIDDVLTTKFLNSICKNPEIIDPIVEAYKLQQQVKENLELKKMSKTAKKVKVDKYFPATEEQKYLMLCEGDSAAGGLMAALGREAMSYFALRGKPLNAHETKASRISDNEELKNIVQILNMDLTKDFQDSLSHDAVVFASDQDLDGIHIRGLLLAFFNRFTPSLIKQGRVCYLQTPVVIGRKRGKIVKWFFEFTEYRKFCQTAEAKELQWDYKKGLGSFDIASEEMQEVIKLVGFENMLRPFIWSEDVPEKIDDWFSNRKADARKDHVRGRSFSIDGI